MKTQRLFEGDTDRYAFDFKLCTTAQGYAQVDTSQDASYFGTWADPDALKIVTYCEGDITIEQAESEAEFVATIRAIKTWNNDNGHRFIGIDPGFNKGLEARFRDIDLGDLLH